MDCIRILFYILLHFVGFGGCFQFSQMDGSLPDPTLETSQGITSEIQYRQVVTGTISPALVTCRCVPPGSCPVVPTVPPPADGSGQIDIRIVNNVSVTGVGVSVNLTVFSSWFQQLRQQWLLLRIHVYMV